MRFLPAIILTIFIFASCKKDEDNKTTVPPIYGPNDSVSILIQIVHRSAQCKDSFRLTSNFPGISQLLLEFREYDSCRFPNSFYKKRFEYEGNRVFIIDSTLSLKTTDTLITDGQKRILELHSATSAGVLYFHYDANGQLLRTVSSSTFGGNDTTFATFSNGDLTVLTSQSGDIHQYTYYLDKRVPASGYFTQHGLRFGSAYYVRNTHLIKSESFGGITISYTYTYDWIGNIATKIATQDNNPLQSDTTFYRYVFPIS